jgi:hypothetical protein
MRLNAKAPDVNTTIIIKQKRHAPRAGSSEPGTGSMAVMLIMLLFFCQRMRFLKCSNIGFHGCFRPNIAFVGHVPWPPRKHAAQRARLPPRRAVVKCLLASAFIGVQYVKRQSTLMRR